MGDTSLSACLIVAEFMACPWAVPRFSALRNSVISCEIEIILVNLNVWVTETNNFLIFSTNLKKT